MVILDALYNLFVIVEFFLLVAVVITFLARFLEVEMLKDFLKIFFTSKPASKPAASSSSKYPTVPSENASVETIELYGKKIPDPYVCLEDLSSAVTKRWYQAQKKYADDYFGTISEVSSKIVHEIREAQKFEVIDAPFHHGDLYFFFKRLRPEHSQFSLFSTNNLNVEAKLIFDTSLLQPNPAAAEAGPLSPDARLASHSQVIHASWVSDDGYKMVVGYSDSLTSSDMTMVVRDLKNRRELPGDTITGCDVRSTSVSWLTSRIGFFYTTQSARPAENRNFSRVWFHRLGLEQSHDLLVYEHITEASNPQSLSTTITSDGHYLLMEIYKTHHELSANSSYRFVAAEHSASTTSSVGNKVYYFDLTKFDGKSAEALGACFKFIDTFSFRFQYISNIEEDFWFRTNYKAPNFRVVRISLPEFFTNQSIATAEIEHKLLISWKTCLEWIPERRGTAGFLETVGIAAHTVLVLKYLVHGAHEVLLFDLTGDLMEESQIPVAALPHPPYGTISGPNCNFYSSDIFYQYSDFGDPGSIYRAIVKRDVCTGSIEISFDQLNSTSLPNINKYDYETRQEFAAASGGGSLSAPTSPVPPPADNRRGSSAAAAALAPPKVPVFLFGSKKLFDDYDDYKTKVPCLLYVHSGFGVCTMAKFNLPLLILAKHFNMLIAVANVQGSGVYGASFSANGAKEEKARSINDLANVVKHLVDVKKYTTREQLGMLGGGNGGLVISSLLTGSPGSMAAAVIADGLFDMMKYHLFNNHYLSGVVCGSSAASAGSASPAPPTPSDTGTTSSSADESGTSAEPAWKESAWYFEYGCAEESPEECERLWALSPLHTIGTEFSKQLKGVRGGRASSYPAVMLTCSNTSSHTAVSCKHSFKFLAELQHCCNGIDMPAKPLVIRCLDEKDDFCTSVAALDEVPIPSFVSLAASAGAPTVAEQSAAGSSGGGSVEEITSPRSTLSGPAGHEDECTDEDLTNTALALDSVGAMFAFLTANIGAKCTAKDSEQRAEPL